MKTRFHSSLAALALLFSSCQPARAWDGGGHMITVRIAYDRLPPAKQARLREELTGLRLGATDFSNPAVASTYMDAVRSRTKRDSGDPRGFFEGMFRDWHFVKLPFAADAGPLPSGAPSANGRADVLRGWLRCRELYLARQTETVSYLGETWRIGPKEALAMLIHLTGDAHQPLHTTSHPLPNGSDDSGGNGVTVVNAVGGLNLHSFWDSAYKRKFVAGPAGSRPVKEDAALDVPGGAGVEDAALGGVARAIVTASGLSEEQLRDGAQKLDPADWVRESHERGFADGYNALGADLGEESVALKSPYVDTARKVASARLALAGVRLAAVLETLFAAPVPAPVALVALAAENPDKARFAVIGDFDGRWSQSKAVAKMIRDWKPDFILTVGDNTYRAKTGGALIYQDVVGLFTDYVRKPTDPDAAETRFFPTLGNHDYESSGSGYLKQRIDEYAATFALPKSGDGLHYYEIVRPLVHCFALDANQIRVKKPGGSSTTIYDQTGLGSMQEKWFRERLAASTAPWKIAYFHQPPHHSSTHHGSGSEAMRAWKLPDAGLTAVLTGHVHGYERMIQGKTGIFVTGLGGASFYPFHTLPSKLAPGSEKRYPDPLPPKAEWPKHCGALFVEAAAKEIRFEFRTVGAADPIDRWAITIP